MRNTDVGVVVIYSEEGGVDGCFLAQGGEGGGGVEEDGSGESSEDVINL